MNSREQIINAIRKNKPSPSALPESQLHFSPDENFLLGFLITLDKCGGRFTFVDNLEQISDIIITEFPNAKNICSLVPEVQGNVNIEKIAEPHWLKDVDVTILRGVLGVAENAAIWLPEEAYVHRVLPFITQHLVIVLNKAEVVANMHEAYDKINAGACGYGVFIAGPSKTADIEQALIIGAHGARTLDVIFVE